MLITRAIGLSRFPVSGAASMIRPIASSSSSVAGLSLTQAMTRRKVAQSTLLGMRSSLDRSSFSTLSPTSTTPSSSSSSSSQQDQSSPPNPKAQSAYQRFKTLTKQYGAYAIAMYLALSIVDFTLTFIVVHQIGTDRIIQVSSPIVRQYRNIRFGQEKAKEIEIEETKKRLEARMEENRLVQEEKEKEKKNDNGKDKKENGQSDLKMSTWAKNPRLWAEIGLAYAIHKTALLPIRAGLTVAWTPKVVEWLRARGWISRIKQSSKNVVKQAANKIST